MPVKGIVSLIASEQLAKNATTGRIRQALEPVPEYGYLHIWISGYLDIWILGNWLLHPQSGLLCGAALPGVFSPEKNMSLVLLQPKIVFLEFYLNNLQHD